MDLIDAVRILARQWRLVIPMLVVVALAAGAGAWKFGPQYQATGIAVLLPPNPPVKDPKGAIGSPTNPYLSFSSSLAETAEVLVKRVNKDGPTIDRLAAAGGTAKYDVGDGTDGPTPFITVIATGRTKAETLVTVRLVMEELQLDLADRQRTSGAPPDTWIRMETVTVPNEATFQITSPLRIGAGITAVGLALLVVVVFLADGLAARRRQATAPMPISVEAPARSRAQSNPAVLTHMPRPIPLREGVGDSAESVENVSSEPQEVADAYARFHSFGFRSVKVGRYTKPAAREEQ